jgi:S-DNA-T family DNA segregation ATPase FtsK/SpoIIIE
MLINSGSDLPETAATAIVRAIWRYRSELAPIAIAAAAFVAANTLHRAHHAAWPWLALATLAGVTALTIPPPQWVRKTWAMLDHSAERAYAVAIAAITGGWLSAATAVGAVTPPMPAIAVVLTVACGIPWWANRRRRAKVRVDRMLDAWPEIANATGLPESQIISALVDVWGWRARVRLARGQTINDVITKIPALESGLGTFRGAVRVYPTPDDLANRCEIRVLDIDPHADAIPWPGPSTNTITEPIDLGPFEDASPCRVIFLRRHVLFGGVTGAGKSSGLNVLMGNLAACRDVVIWAIDLKKGMELGPWAPCIDRLATTPDEARRLLADAVKVLEARAALLAERGQRVWQPTPEMPALVIIVDEYAELSDDAPDAIKHADSIARRGRAVAVNLIAATQRPTQKAMGQGAVRSQMDVRISFRVRERKDVDLILGQRHARRRMARPHTQRPGKFLIAAAEHDTPKPARAYLLTDEVVEAAANHYADYRPPLDPASQQAAEAHHDPERIVVPPDADTMTAEYAEDGPDVMLWAALVVAPTEGTTVPDLMTATGMSRPWIYLRLRELVGQGRVIQVSRGRWRAITDDTA